MHHYSFNANRKFLLGFDNKLDFFGTLWGECIYTTITEGRVVGYFRYLWLYPMQDLDTAPLIIFITRKVLLKKNDSFLLKVGSQWRVNIRKRNKQN